jgi:hypothetical protein
MCKLAISILLSVSIQFATAQGSGHASGRCLMFGIKEQPFILTQGFSAATSYSLQLGLKNSRVRPTVCFGFPTQEVDLETEISSDYIIKGAYIQTGVSYYFADPLTEKNVFFIAFMGYLGSYNHKLDAHLVDENWGTEKTYSFTNKQPAVGFTFEWGALFTIYKDLKFSASLNTGAISYAQYPFPKLDGLRSPALLPGVGISRGIAFGASFGLHYQLH